MHDRRRADGAHTGPDTTNGRAAVEEDVRELLARPAIEVAPLLLGWRFSTTIGGARTSVRLAEVEAYMGADDAASHAFRGITNRTTPMFAAGGVIYVYLSYGIHHCVNLVTGPAGLGQAVLLRGGTPMEGERVMASRRGRWDHLADGPGKLGQALGLTTDDSGAVIDGGRIALEPGDPVGPIVRTPRIGISRATDRLWRFVDTGAPGRRSPGPG